MNVVSDEVGFLQSQSTTFSLSDNCARRQAAKAPDCKSGIVSSSLTARSKLSLA